jgi:hypothetical protein
MSVRWLDKLEARMGRSVGASVPPSLSFTDNRHREDSVNALKITGFERYDGDELNPVNRFRIENESALTAWDVTIIQRGDNEWFLTMVDFTNCVIAPPNGTVWSTQSEALADAIDEASRARRRTSAAA